jgi:TRAP-type C4-dicarboxylate transport system permease small subunit
MLAAIVKISELNRLVLLTVSVVCLILAMGLVSADAIMRKLATPIPGAIPFTEFLVSGLVFFGIVVAQSSGLHLNVTIIDKALSPLNRLCCDLFGLGITLFVTVLVGWFGTLQTLDSWMSNEVTESTIDVPVWPARFLLAFGCLLLALEVILNAIRLILRYPADPDSKDESAIKVMSE